jgi:hypothetical protein
MQRLSSLVALIALVAAGCGPASAPTNAIVTVINLSDVTGTFRWDSSDATVRNPRHRADARLRDLRSRIL